MNAEFLQKKKRAENVFVIIKPKRVCGYALIIYFHYLWTYTRIPASRNLFFILLVYMKSTTKESKEKRKASKYVISRMIDGKKPRHYMNHASHCPIKYVNLQWVGNGIVSFAVEN